MRFRAVAEASGCAKITLPSAPMLKLDQLSTACSVVCFTVSVLPKVAAVALPLCTKPEALEPQAPDTQTLGSAAAWTLTEDRTAAVHSASCARIASARGEDWRASGRGCFVALRFTMWTSA